MMMMMMMKMMMMMVVVVVVIKMMMVMMMMAVIKLTFLLPVYTADDTLGRSMNDSLARLINETSFRSNGSSPGNQTEATRIRRGLGMRGSGTPDWWYGNWCGPYQGGYEDNPRPQCKAKCGPRYAYISDACRRCLPPRDGLDEACMEHDR